MITARRFAICTSASTVLLSVVAAPCPNPLFAQEPSGTLRLTIDDARTGQPVPARVEIRGADGAYYVAEDALPASGDCSMGDPGSGPVDQAASVEEFFDRFRINNPYTGTPQFYSTGKSSVRLPAGTATIRVFKGPEYKVSVEKIEIADGAAVEHTIGLTRWIDMPQKGWYSADDHLHIPRPSPESNAGLSKMLQAEDINVGNLLQMGKVTNFDIAKQYAHGPGGLYQEGNYILAAGQENPRTHFLGHTITLGAASAHFNREKYLIYRLLWEETVKEGAINGYAHLVALDAVELVQNGNVVNRFSRLKGDSKIEFSVTRRVDESSWFAVRAYGTRLDENTFVNPIIFSSFEPTSSVHTSPIYVSLRNRPGIEKSAHSKAVAESFLARLNDMERLLAEDNVVVLAAKLADPTMDIVPKDVFLANRQDLLDEIRVAKDFFESRAQ